MRIEARELVIYGIECDSLHCETLIHTSNAQNKPEGFYMSLERVTQARAGAARVRSSSSAKRSVWSKRCNGSCPRY